MKCTVKDCENHFNEGKFKGDICYPCHAFITNGEGVHSQVYRNTKREWAGLTDKEINSVMETSKNLEGSLVLPYGYARDIETKLKEKNNG